MLILEEWKITKTTTLTSLSPSFFGVDVIIIPLASRFPSHLHYPTVLHRLQCYTQSPACIKSSYLALREPGSQTVRRRGCDVWREGGRIQYTSSHYHLLNSWCNRRSVPYTAPSRSRASLHSCCYDGRLRIHKAVLSLVPRPHPLTRKKNWLPWLCRVSNLDFQHQNLYDVALFHWAVQYQDCWLSTTKFNGHQTLFLVRGQGLGTRLHHNTSRIHHTCVVLSVCRCQDWPAVRDLG